MKLFIWPKPKIFSLIKNSLNFNTQKQINSILLNLYKGGFPVICSSGRVAINLILNLHSLNKKNQVDIFPFVSTCVVEAISKTCTPFTLISNNRNSLKISYNQWGYKDLSNQYKKIFIEDSADSLTKPKTCIFNNSNTDYVIWSLPKILGTYSGGVIWCRKKEDSDNLNKIIYSKKPSLFMLISRITSHWSNLFYRLWNYNIYNHPNLTSIECSEIFYKLNNINNIIDDRKKKLTLFKELLPKNYDYASGIFPTVIPIKIQNYKYYEKYLNSCCGIRHFLDFKSNNYKKVFPLPIHQDISYEKLKKFKNKFYD